MSTIAVEDVITQYLMIFLLVDIKKEFIALSLDLISKKTIISST